MTLIQPDDLPNAPGTYVLIMPLKSPAILTIGQLGAVSLVSGWYAYVGSARGAGGLQARIGRHLRADKPRHWHIDSLTAQAPVVAVWLDTSAQRLECDWAHILAALPGVTAPVPGFGSSDCTCRTHLFWLPRTSLRPAWEALAKPAIRPNDFEP